MTAVHAVLIKRSLPYVDNSAIQLAYWTNATAALMLLPFVFFNGEVASVWVGLGYGQFTDPIAAGVSHPGAVITPPTWDWQTFVLGCLVTGVVGFLLCVAGKKRHILKRMQTLRGNIRSLEHQDHLSGYSHVLICLSICPSNSSWGVDIP